MHLRVTYAKCIVRQKPPTTQPYIALGLKVSELYALVKIMCFHNQKTSSPSFVCIWSKLVGVGHHLFAILNNTHFLSSVYTVKVYFFWPMKGSKTTSSFLSVHLQYNRPMDHVWDKETKTLISSVSTVNFNLITTTSLPLYKKKKMTGTGL